VAEPSYLPKEPAMKEEKLIEKVADSARPASPSHREFSSSRILLRSDVRRARL
jgi:hypothetical protein